MEQKFLARNAIALHAKGPSSVTRAEHHLKTQVAALEATIAYCQTHRQRYEEKAKIVEAICSQLQLPKGKPN